MDMGWLMKERSDRADVVVINTCIVTGRASYQSRQAIRKAIRENPGALVAATGCYAQVYPQELEEISGLHLIAGNTLKGRLPELLSRGEKTAHKEVFHEEYTSKTPFECLPVRSHPGRTRAFLKIQDGCRSFCTYCIVPYARGGLRSLSPEKVLASVSDFGREGYQEVVLTGIHLGKYGVDLDPPLDLSGLLRGILAEKPDLRIRLSSLEPEEVTTGLIDVVASETRLCPHFHVSLQSGDNHVLGLMRRRYTKEAFSETILDIRKKIPHAGIGLDVMLGFPGETDEAFENTKSLIEGLPVSYLHVFRFSPRPGTPAARFPDPVPPGVIKERASLMRRLGRAKRREFYQSCVGGVFPVIVEEAGGRAGGLARGFADNYAPMAFRDKGGSFEKPVFVRAERVQGDCVLGTGIGESSARNQIQ